MWIIIHSHWIYLKGTEKYKEEGSRLYFHLPEVTTVNVYDFPSRHFSVHVYAILNKIRITLYMQFLTYIFAHYYGYFYVLNIWKPNFNSYIICASYGCGIIWLIIPLNLGISGFFPPIFLFIINNIAMVILAHKS